MTMITPSYLGETIEYSSLHACRSTLEDPTLVEACAATNAVVYRLPAQKAVSFIPQAQNNGLGWRYTPKCGSNDTSVTGWCVLALKSAESAGLEVPKNVYDGAKQWIVRVTDANGQVGYDKLGSGEIFVPGKNESWKHHQTMTGVGVFCRILIDGKKPQDPMVRKGMDILSNDLPRFEAKFIDGYYWHAGTLALMETQSLPGSPWDQWRKSVGTALVSWQQWETGDPCREGSWHAGNYDRWAYAGGRICATALNVITLEHILPSKAGTRLGDTWLKPKK